MLSISSFQNHVINPFKFSTKIKRTTSENFVYNNPLCIFLKLDYIKWTSKFLKYKKHVLFICHFQIIQWNHTFADF